MTEPSHLARVEASFDDAEHWHHVTCRSHSLTNCRFDVQGPFRATLRSQSLGECSSGATFSSSFACIHSRRSSVETRSDGVDDFMVLHVVQGSVKFEQGGRSLTAGSGDVFLYDQSQPFALDLTGKHHLAFMVIPRAAMVERLADAEHLTARALRADASAGELARSVMRFVVDTADFSGSTTERLGRAALDILAAAFDPSLLDPKPLQSHRLLEAAQAYMLKHLAENKLDVRTIAHALGVAPRTLNRIFAAEGSTPMRWLWQQRLSAAHDCFSRQRYDTVTSVAGRCGFGDLPHFSRLFKQRYGMSPQTAHKKYWTG